MRPFFYAEQNARLVADAERYYRTMFRGGANTWNLRDTHMADTLDALSAHLSRAAGGEPAKLIVWAHNSHLGDARHTEMGTARGEINVGQLMRQRHDQDVFNLGFTTHTGTVTAANNWDESPRRMAVVPSRPDSIEHVCHLASLEDPQDGQSPMDQSAFALLPDPRSTAAQVLDEERLERAIGVIYRPATERWSHYFRCRPGRQFDALLHVERTRALHPLDPVEGFLEGHAGTPETFPTGL